MNKKIHVVILFGGRSAEHEVSVRSAKRVLDTLDKNKYFITLIGIDKNGRWLSLSEEQLLNRSKVYIKDQNLTSNITPYNNHGKFLIKWEGKAKKVDVVLPILHGPYGEDGTIQGLLKTANVPFVGSGVLGSAIGMDKDVMKRLLDQAGIPLAKFIVYIKHQEKEIVFEKIRNELKLPFFIKPANLGSSIGISKIHNKEEFVSAIKSAFLYDNKIIIEEYIKGREIECSVLGNEKPIVSIPGEIIPHREFYSYEAKYIDKNGAELSIPAELSKQTARKIQKLAIKTFEVLCAEGMARVDFFLTKKNKIFVNEINTIPGFTSVSMFPKLWEYSGISNVKLIDMLIDLAIQRFNSEKKLRTTILK